MALTLEIITPEDKVYSKQVDDVVLPTEAGEIDVLAGHLPLLTKIAPGEVIANHGGTSEALAVDRGFARIQGDVVSILTEAAINVEEIDLNQVEEARKRAEAALDQAKKDNLPPEEVERLQAVARFSIAQQLAKARRVR